MGLDDLDPFAIFDEEAERLDRHFAGLDEAAWLRPPRCAAWAVRDVLAHLAGAEAYNHACLDDDLEGLSARMESAGITSPAEFNDWSGPPAGRPPARPATPRGAPLPRGT